MGILNRNKSSVVRKLFFFTIQAKLWKLGKSGQQRDEYEQLKFVNCD